ncbi:hypothetical protein JXA32_05740 [Candidatus Sumerlaeota bacterium]|nr:hypothetical protein [Candidatus Sumerlaeota bacterium]
MSDDIIKIVQDKLDEKNEVIKEQQVQIQEQDQKIEEIKEELEDKNNVIKEQQLQIAELEGKLEEMQARIAELEQTATSHDELVKRLKEAIE